MRARYMLTRSSPVALFVSLALVSAPGIPLAAEGPEANPEPAAQESALAERIAEAETKLRAAHTNVATTYEKVTAAQERQERASKAAATARAKAAQVDQNAKDAARHAEQLRKDIDEFAAASYRQGSMVGSAIAFLGSESSTDMLARSTLLNAIGSNQLDILGTAKRTVHRQASTGRIAVSALEKATDNAAAAKAAKANADRAHQAALEQKESAQQETDDLIARQVALTQPEPQPAPEVAPVAAPPPGPAVSPTGVVMPTIGEMTSTYGPRWGTFHYGIDFGNSIGTPIYSVLPGEVISSGPATGFGLWVRVQHDNGAITVYGHIDESLVSVGQRVGAGEQIATLGNRGESTGPHLHFEVMEGGVKIDPLEWLRGHGMDL